MHRDRGLHGRLLCGTAAIALLLATGAHAEEAKFNIAAQPLADGLNEFAKQSGRPVMFTPEVAGAKMTRGVADVSDPEKALNLVLADTGLTWRKSGDTFLIVSASDPQSGSAAGDGADGTVQALIVTAQKREEDIQDVPIAISAFTQEDLTRSQVAGGPDLITQVPNFTFTKTNFSSYSIQIRGIGTQAISATTDPAVAVAFNNTPFIRNRFFEQEFYDLERVEVLRGPQGTLYGRNATAGVVNIISAKPKFRYEAKLSGDVGNYSSSRIEGMLNIPLVEDKVAVRLAGAWTKRDGYAVNELTGNPIDGRDLWSTRLSLRVAPTEKLNVNLIWEHFQEDDDRLRSGKQLCKKDVVTEVAGFSVTNYYASLPNTGQNGLLSGPEATFSQGCTRESLYAKDSFQRPNGLMLPYYMPLGAIGLPTALSDPYVPVVDSSLCSPISGCDPNLIASTNDQPENLRVIQSTIDPTYRAKNDLGELQISYDLTDHLTLSSETAYATDSVYSLQDFNRFNTAAGAWGGNSLSVQEMIDNGVLRTDLGPNLTFCDPQLGCSDRLVAVDISTARARQFSQELRLSSAFDGPFNFSIGANFLRGDSEDKYYVFINSLSLIAASGGVVGRMTPYVGGVSDNFECLANGHRVGDPNSVYPVTGCVYLDPNPIGSVNDQGHNYFLSKNPYKLISYAVFGETYFKITNNLKLTAGLRWTVDKKRAPRIPTWILASNSVGYPVAEVIQQEWREPTGRLALDWKPQLSFTDETLIYGSFAHGYKAGGANPPGFVRVFYSDPSVAQTNSSESATRPRTFEPEFVNAFEVGTKNTILQGRATLNLTGFYYDYTGYQVSEIVDRSAFNRNFDATVWGMELESEWRLLENFKIGVKGGYEKTRIADGEQAIDLMDRTAGDPRWLLVRPFPTYASSCILPAWLFIGNGGPNPQLVNLGGAAGGGPGGCEIAYQIGQDPGLTAAGHSGTINYAAWSTDPDDYPGYAWPGGIVTNSTYPGWDPSTAPNGGEGIMKPLGGNELPNAPHWTATVMGDYTLPLPNDWLMSLHTDVHWQSQSWWRVFNDSTYDKLHPYFTMNLAAIFTNEERGWNIMAYIKNVTDETAITGAFLNSDDTGLTTNVFLTEPRLFGLRVTKQWTDGPLFSNFASTDGPFWVEVGGQVQRFDAANTALHPTAANAFTGNLDLLDPSQRDDLDWGDARELRLIYQPRQSPWRLTGSIRYGKTNGEGARYAAQVTDPVCLYADALAYRCELLADNPIVGPFTHFSQTDWAQASAHSREEHRAVEFTVGRNVNLGALEQSYLSVGLRGVSLKSATTVNLRGTPDWTILPGFFQPGHLSTHTSYDMSVAGERAFKGAGPTVSWESSYPVFALDSGQLKMDWTLTGGVLFGQQKASGTSGGRTVYTEQNALQLILPGQFIPAIPTLATLAPESYQRSESATVPLLDAALGLTYSTGGVKIGGGYRWERYFNAIDGGFSEHKSYDRTLDGPYFKVSIGFGG